MPHINTTQYALLGILLHSPMAGYDIKKFIDQSISFFWSENYGHIYPVLKKLEKEKLVTKQVKHTPGKPSKNIYSVTGKGRQMLTNWLAAPVQKEMYRLEILLKLFFGYWSDINTMIDKIKTHKHAAEKKLEAFSAIEQHINTEHHEFQKDKPPYELLCLNYGKHYYRAVLKWCDETLNILNTERNKQT